MLFSPLESSERSKQFCSISASEKEKCKAYKLWMFNVFIFFARLVYCRCSRKQLTSVFAFTNFGIAINLSRRSREREAARNGKTMQKRDFFLLSWNMTCTKRLAEGKRTWKNGDTWKRFHIARRGNVFVYETCVSTFCERVS